MANITPAQMKLRILVVDDEPFVCDAVRMMLTYDGHSVETAADAEAALAKFEVGKFDVIITDFAMPGMQGDRFALTVKQRSPKQPIVMLSAHGPMLRVAGLPGVDDIVDKPFRFESLRSSIEKVLQPGGVLELPPSLSADANEKEHCVSAVK